MTTTSTSGACKETATPLAATKITLTATETETT